MAAATWTQSMRREAGAKPGAARRQHWLLAGVSPAQQQQRLDAPDLEQRHEREEQRDEQADGNALDHSRGRYAVGHAAE